MLSVEITIELSLKYDNTSKEFSVKIFISMILGLTFISTIAVAAPAKRKIAQKVECVPMGIEFDIYAGQGDNLDYSTEELKMLRNSIYAQVGFQFKSAAIANEMLKRGCSQPNAKYRPQDLKPVDKKNARNLKSFERSAKEFDQMNDFAGAWDKSANSPTDRAKLLASNYCYLSDANQKYFGILFFESDKSGSGFELKGMMNLAKPSWAEQLSEAERQVYLSNIKYRELDTTSANVLDFQTKGSWAVSSAREASGQVQITLKSDHKNMSDSRVNITAPNYKDSHMLECQLAQ